MKIKLALLEKDTGYLKRIMAVFGSRYADKLQIYSFTDKEQALKSVAEQKINVLLAHQDFDITSKDVPSGCGFAYLVESADIKSIREEKTVAKYQMAEQIYKQVLLIFSEINNQITALHADSDSRLRVVAVTSASGGVGTSSIAAALCVRLAMQQKRVLYLNLEKFAASELIFQGEGELDFSDVIYALKGKNTNVALKLESIIRQDTSGVAFIEKCKNALDMQEINMDDVERLLETIKSLNHYDYLIIDMDLSYAKNCLKVLSYADVIDVISDGSTEANIKTGYAIDSFKILDEQKDGNIVPRMKILYNRFGSQNGVVIERDDVQVLGGLPRYEAGTKAQLVEQMALMAVLDSAY